jgi:hypothetical protein
VSLLRRHATDSDGQSPPDLTYDQRLQQLDRSEGRRDGKNRMPAVRQLNAILQAGPGTVPSLPYVGRLVHQAERFWATEWERFERETAEIRARIAGLTSDVNNVKDARAEAETRLAEARKIAAEPLTDDDLQPRSPDEETLAQPVLRARRAAVRRQDVVNAEHHLDMLTQSLKQPGAQLAQSRELVRNRREETRARVEQISAHFSERIDMYWSGLVEKHWAGRQLSLLPRQRLSAPEWATSDEVPFDPTIEGGDWS